MLLIVETFFNRFLYDQPTVSESVEEAEALYYLGEKYNVPAVCSIAQQYLLNNLNAENSDNVYEIGLLFKDKALVDAVYKTIVEPTTSTMKSLLDPESTFQRSKEFEIDFVSSEDALSAILAEEAKTITTDTDIKRATGRAIGRIHFLIEQAKNIYKIIDPNNSHELVCSLQWYPGPGRFEKLNKYWTDTTPCKICSNNNSYHYHASNSNNHKLIDCAENGLSSIYYKYKHTNLTKYETNDLKKVYEVLDTKFFNFEVRRRC